MDWVYYILIPLISAFISGLIGGLFTFLGVRHTIKNENKRFMIEREKWEKERKERERDRQEAKWQENKKQNEIVIKNRPQVRIVEETDNIVDILKIKLLPYMNVKLNSISEGDPNSISFNYPDKIYSDDYWEKYEFVIKNIGKTKIDTGFLMIPYQSNVNMYWYDLKALFNFCNGQYYSEKELIGHSLKEGDSLKVIVFYPKTCPQFKEIPFTLYMWDKTGNYWKQEAVNFPGDHSDSEIISGEEYSLNVNEGIQKKFELVRLYFAKYNAGIDMPFDYRKSCIYLESLKRKLWAKEEEFRVFKRKVKTGEVLLYKNFDI